METLADCFTLSNGYKIPCVGFGTWQIPNGEATINAVKTAIENGYRHIDTAYIYNNEVGVGEAVKLSGVDRRDIFITSKVWNSERGYEKTLAAFEKTLKNLQLTYLDLYLIHWPAARGDKKDWTHENSETWRAMEKLYKEGRVKAIGVCNFKPHHLIPLIKDATIKPMINQIELHPGMLQTETVEFCREHNILVEAWSPLGSGRMLSNLYLIDIAKKYNKTVAHLCIKWILQKGILPLPKSVTPSRILANTKVFDFEISEEDMKKIDQMPHCGDSGLDPDKITF